MSADLKTTLFLLSTEFRASQDHLKEHLTVLHDAVEALLAGGLPDEEKTTLLKSLPSIISSLVSSDRVVKDRALFLASNKLFLKIVNVILRDLPENPEIVGLLCDVFRVERFFDVSSIQDLEPEQFEDCVGEFASVDGNEKVRLSVFAAKIINAFGEGHGFDMLGNVLESTTNVNLIKLAFRLVASIYKPMRRKVLSGYLKAYTECSFKHLLDLRPEQLKLITREDISDIVSHVEPVVRWLEWEDGDRVTDEFCLVFSLKSFQSDMIEKRRSGLEYIDDVVQVNLSRFINGDDDYYESWAMMGQRQRPKPRWLTKSWMLNWLLENRILDAAFDPKSTKEPLIKKSRYILSLIASDDKLKPEIIDAIWACSRDKYFQDATYEVVLGSLKYWQQGAVRQFWKKMEALPKNQYTVDFCEFLYRVLREVHSSRNSGAIEPNDVLSLYWQAMQDDSDAPTDVRHLSLLKAISTISEFGALASRKLDFYPVFIRSIRHDKSATQVIRVLDQVIDHLHQNSNRLSQKELREIQFSSRTELVQALENHFNLVTMIVQELTRYKASIVPLLLHEIDVDGGQTALYKVLHPTGKLFTHQKCLEYRLDFLFRVLHRLGPNNAFNEEAADLVFSQIFYSDDLPVIHSEKEMCLNFIRIVIFPALDGSGEPGITVDVARHIFENWFCSSHRNDFRTMSQSDFFSFKSFFCYINKEKIKILKADQMAYCLIFATRSVDLVGVNEMWQLLTLTDNDSVFDVVSGTLVMIYTRFTTALQDPVDDINKRFLETLFTLLQKSRANLTRDPLNEREARVVNRLVKMLRQFLNATQKPFEPIPDERLASQEDSYAIMPVPTSQSEIDAVRQVMEFTGVNELVAVLVLKSCRWSLEHAMNALFDDERRSQIETEAEKYAKAQPKPKEEPPKANVTPTKELLVNDQGQFDTLLNLLSLPLIDRDAVWEIVESLPPNRNIETALRSLTEINFSELLDVNSVFKMLYTLRIIDSHMLPTGHDPSPELLAETKAWCRKFYHSGGFAFVYNLVQTMGLSASSQSAAHKSCVVILLKIVHHFMKGSLKDLAFSPQKKAPNPSNVLTLSQGTSQALVDQMDFPGFLNVLRGILWNIIKENEPKDAALSSSSTHYQYRTDNIELVNHAMYLLASIVASRPSLLEELYENTTVPFKTLLMQSILGIKSKELRERFSIGWQQLCAEVKSESVGIPSPSSKILGILLEDVPFGREPSLDADDYFDLLVKLFTAHFDEASALVDVAEFAKKLIDEVFARPGDKSESDAHRDHLLAGFLSLLVIIMKNRSDIKELVAESLLSDLLEITLVKRDGPFVAKCLSSPSRTASFELMKELIKESPHLQDTTLKLIAPILNALRDQKRDSGTTAKRDKFVGFLNPRHISCYANSLIQQFYMIPSFRSALFEVSAPETPETPETPPIQEGSALAEIRRIFGFLQLSERHHIDPTELLQLFAKKMNINQQNDASEFFSHLLERLEEDLAPTNRKTLVDDIFKLTLNREIICGDNKEHVSAGIEENLVLGVEIFKTTNLQQALANMFEGDKIESYRCDTCKRPVDARRVWSLKTLPPNLVVHIKRFAMDFNTMLLEKVTSRFEYPFELNLKDFRGHNSDIPEEQCIYDLVGVVVHSGTRLEAGHYYSFIKERGEDDHRWWRFDDTVVTEFDVDDLGEETFGGEHHHLPREERENWQYKNAYMLFYEQRNRPRPTSDLVRDVAVPPSLAQAITQDNTQLLRERLSADRLSFDFTKSILESFTFKPIKTLEALDESSPVFLAIEMMTSLLLDGKVDKANPSAFDAWVTALIRHYENHVPACRWFLATLMTTKAKAFTQLLLDASELSIRLAFKRLVLAALTTLYHAEAPNFPEDFDKDVVGRDENGKIVAPLLAVPPPLGLQDFISKFACVAFVDHLICMFEDTRPRWQRFHQFWDLMNGVVNLGQPMRRYLGARQLLYWLADYYMGPYSLRWKKVNPHQDRVRLGIQGEMHLLLLHEFFEVMTSMITASHTRATEVEAKAALEADRPMTLPVTARYGELVCRDEAAEELLLRVDVLSSLIKQAYSVHSNIALCQHLSWEDEERSALVLSVLMTSVKRGTTERMPVVLPVIEELLATEDSLKYWRAAVVMSVNGIGFFAVCQDALETLRQSERQGMIEELLNFCYKCAQQNPRVARALRMKTEEIKTVVNHICQTLIEEVQVEIERYEHTDDQLRLARLSEVNMRWNALFEGEAGLKEEPFPDDFDLAKFAFPTLQQRDDN